MEKIVQALHGESSPPTRRHRLAQAVSIAALCMAIPNANAFEIDTGNPDVKVRWDNTVKYMAMWRLDNQSSTLTSLAANPNNIELDDGDRNFDKGLVSNRIDLLSELDFTYLNYGFRVSGAAWADSAYSGSANDNDSAATANSFSVANDHFTSATRNLHGHRSELLDAFVFGKFQLDNDKSAILRVGKHTLLWGESLFFGANGIAGGQAPMDFVKLLTVPNSQFKEIIRPVGQVSGQLQVSPSLSFGAYYQYEWEKNRVPAAGSYLSFADILDDGGERFIAGAPGGPFLAPPAFFRGTDQKAKDSGQYGFQVRIRPEGEDVEYGLYAIRYHDKSFQVYLRPSAGVPNFVTGQIGEYDLAYAENIKAYGASVSTSIGPVNVGGEISIRRNTPLVNPGVVITPGTIADNNNKPQYPVGNSAHAQISAIYLLTPNGLWEGGNLLAEAAWNRRTSITKNPQALDPSVTRDAWGFRVLFSPAYYQVAPGWDVKIPIGLGYNPKGKSSVVSLFNGGVDKGGDFSIGVVGDYQKAWTAGLNYTHFLGDAGSFFNQNATLSFKQPYKDRDYISFSVQHTW